MTTTTATDSVHIVLIPGFWLGAWAWADVARDLAGRGGIPHPVTLPGLDPGATDADRAMIGREDHVNAVSDLVAGLDGRVVLVGHSGGAPVAQQVADRDPARITRIIYVDAGPLVDGAVLNAQLAPDASELPLPTWDELAEQGLSLAGIDADGLADIRARAVPMPAGVAREPVRLTNPDRLDVPATVICSSIPSATLAELADPGPPLHTELTRLTDLSYVDLPTGHWPMFSRPGDLAAEIAAAAGV